MNVKSRLTKCKPRLFTHLVICSIPPDIVIDEDILFKKELSVTDQISPYISFVVHCLRLDCLPLIPNAPLGISRTGNHHCHDSRKTYCKFRA